MPYTFDPIFAVDPGNPANVAANAELVIFTPGDTLMSPLTLTNPDGLPFANPVTTNGSGFAGAFVHESLGRVAWAGGGFTGFFTAYDSLKEEAVAAAAASDSSAQSSAVSAQAAQDAAALVDAPADQIMADTAANPATAFATQLSATIAEKSADLTDAADTVVLMGTSITAQNGNLASVPNGIGRTSVTGYEIASTTHLLDPTGYWHYAATMSGQRLTAIANKGIGGNTTTQMLARFDTDVLGLSPRPSWLLLEPGPNDQGGGIPAATSIANVTEMIARARKAGMRVILCTITPSNTLTTAGNADRARVNAWIKQNAPSFFPGTLIVDWTKSVVDPAGGPLLTAFRNESGSYVHPTPYGAAPGEARY